MEIGFVTHIINAEKNIARLFWPSIVIPLGNGIKNKIKKVMIERTIPIVGE